jgi:hypothetical protein
MGVFLDFFFGCWAENFFWLKSWIDSSPASFLEIFFRSQQNRLGLDFVSTTLRWAFYEVLQQQNRLVLWKSCARFLEWAEKLDRQLRTPIFLGGGFVYTTEKLILVRLTQHLRTPNLISLDVAENLFRI